MRPAAAQHADERDDLRQPLAQDTLELPPGVHQIHVHAGARGVDERPVAHQAEVHLDGFAVAQRGQGVASRLDAEVGREVVEGAGRDHQQRQARLPGDRGRRADRAVAPGHAEDPGAGRGQAQPRGQVSRVGLDDRGLGQVRGQPRGQPGRGRSRGRVDDQRQALPGHRDRRLPRRPDRYGRPRRPPRPPAQGRQPRRGADGRPGQDIRRVVHARGHPRGADRRGQRDPGRGQRRHLDRRPDGEGRRVRGVPGREGRAPGNSPQPASDGNVGVRAAPARQALADDVGRRAGRRHAAQAAPGGPPGLPVARGPQRGGQHHPEETVVGQT